jgi:hypothetical protein
MILLDRNRLAAMLEATTGAALARIVQQAA